MFERIAIRIRGEPGKVLLDCGRTPGAWVGPMVVAALVCMPVAITAATNLSIAGLVISILTDLFLFGSVFVPWAVLSRTELRERGMWSPMAWAPWDRVTGWQFYPIDDRKTGLSLVCRTGSGRVSEEVREFVIPASLETEVRTLVEERAGRSWPPSTDRTAAELPGEERHRGW